MKTINQVEEEKRLLDVLSTYAFSIGVVQKDTKREQNKDKKIKEFKANEITNADLLFIHENGSPMRNLPARPVLQITIEWASSQLDDLLNECVEGILNGWSEKELETHVKQFGSRMENYAYHLIYDNDGTLAPNSPSWIERNKKWNERNKKGPRKKDYNHPLFQTGDLARSITVELVKIT